MKLHSIAAVFALVLSVAPRLGAQDLLPVLKPKSTVVFIGDSITDGGRAMKGNDYNHTMGQSYPFIISSRLGNRLAERNLTFINRGISANTVTDLRNRWQTDVLDLKPDFLSILIGVNDTFSPKGGTFELFEEIYDQLLRDTIAALPKIRIVLGEPFLLPVGKFKDDYASKLVDLKKRQDVVTRLAAKYKLPVVRYQAAFDAATRRAPADHWLWDGIHPHYAGHDLMAEEWLKTVEKMGP